MSTNFPTCNKCCAGRGRGGHGPPPDGIPSGGGGSAPGGPRPAPGGPPAAAQGPPPFKRAAGPPGGPGGPPKRGRLVELHNSFSSGSNMTLISWEFKLID